MPLAVVLECECIVSAHLCDYSFSLSPSLSLSLSSFLSFSQGGSGIATGLLTELGPWVTNDDSFTKNQTEVPAIFHNEYGWQKVSNMLFVSAPAGVSFSYCKDKCPPWTDKSAAVDNHDFLQQFFQSYPEYQSNDFYITGNARLSLTVC